MSERVIDPTLLDDIICGDNTPEARETWRALVRASDAAEMWAEAVKRRQRLDEWATLVHGREWLARLLLELRRSARRVAELPEALAQVVVCREPALATLGPSQGPPTVEPGLRWGQVQHLRVPVDSMVGIQPPSEMLNATVLFATAHAEGKLPQGTWKLEAGEAPVLLVAVAGETSSLSEAANLNLPTACLVLLEQAD